MDAAGAGEATRLLDVAPLIRKLGPLPGPLEVTDAVRARDSRAVDDGRRERIEVTGQRRRRSLVEQRQTAVELSEVDERSALGDDRERLQIRVAEALAELVGGLRVRERLLELPRPPGVDAADERGLAVLERLGLGREDPLSLGEPAVEDGDVPPAQVVERKAYGD